MHIPSLAYTSKYNTWKYNAGGKSCAGNGCWNSGLWKLVLIPGRVGSAWNVSVQIDVAGHQPDAENAGVGGRLLDLQEVDEDMGRWST
jgi:hypothetical protein